jgi:hypothetical protein
LYSKLYQIYETLTIVSYAVQHGWLDGAAMYLFFKKGGIHNLIACFHWLSQQINVIGSDFTQLAVYLFDDSCLQIKTILHHLINPKSNDNSINSLLNANFGSDFDNAKNMYQTFYHVICTKLLLID